MKHSGTILTIGVILIILPLLGFPGAWRSFLLVVFGLILCGFVVEIHISKSAKSKRAHHKREPRSPVVSPAVAPTVAPTASFAEHESPQAPADAPIFPNDHEQTPQA